MKGKRACSSRIPELDCSKRMAIYMDYELSSSRRTAAHLNKTQLTDDMESDEEGASLSLPFTRSLFQQRLRLMPIDSRFQEHHLQKALKNEYTIPTPNVAVDTKLYDRIYRVECAKPKGYIRTNGETPRQLITRSRFRNQGL